MVTSLRKDKTAERKSRKTIMMGNVGNPRGKKTHKEKEGRLRQWPL
jgi:hypothetical protein